MFDIKQIPKDPIINALGTLFSQENAELTFIRIVDFDTSVEEFEAMKKVIRDFFDETQNSVEAYSGMPNNIFAESEFDKWLHDLDFDEIRILGAQLKTRNKPSALMIQVSVNYFTPNTIVNSKSCEMSLRTGLLSSNSGPQGYFFPIQTKNIVLVVYRGFIDG